MVVEHGTLPLDDLYFALKPLSKNGGAVDYEQLVEGGDIFPEVAAGRGFRAVPHRRCGRRAQHPRRDLRRHPVRDADLILALRGVRPVPSSTLNWCLFGARMASHSRAWVSGIGNAIE